MLKMIQFSRAYDAGTNREITHAHLVEV
jgi:hypothetical protein